MFISAIENFVLFCTCFALVGFAVAWVARGAASRGLWQPHPYTLARLYTSTLVIPPVASAWLVAAALLPESWLGKAAFDAAHHESLRNMHLLSELTGRLEPMLAYLLISFTVVSMLFIAGSSARNYLRIGEVIKRLEATATPPPPGQLALVNAATMRHKLQVGLVMSNYPFSFVWGFWRSKLILSSGLLCALSAEELSGLLEHEAAHHSRRDNLVKLVLSVCSYSSLAFPFSKTVCKWRGVEVEMVCDEVAAARTSAPLEIAEALVKLRRQTLPLQPRIVAGDSASGFTTDGDEHFEHRVSRLIAFTDGLPDPAHAAVMSRARKGAAILVATVFPATLIITLWCAPFAVHHAAESLISFLG